MGGQLPRGWQSFSFSTPPFIFGVDGAVLALIRRWGADAIYAANINPHLIGIVYETRRLNGYGHNDYFKSRTRLCDIRGIYKNF